MRSTIKGIEHRSERDGMRCFLSTFIQSLLSIKLE